MIRSRWSRRNLLIRRIQRHADISALFGAGAPRLEGTASPPRPGQEAGVESTPVQTSAGLSWRKPVPVVTAWLAPTPAPGEAEYQAAGEAETEPPPRTFSVEDQLTSGPQQEQSARPLQEETVAGIQRVKESSKTVAQAHPQPAENLTPPGPTPAEPLQGETRTEAEDTPRTDDSTWKRLQTIFRRHEKKRREEAAGTDAQPIEAPPQQPAESHSEEAAGRTASYTPEEKSWSESNPAAGQETLGEDAAKGTQRTTLQRQTSDQEPETLPKVSGMPEERPAAQALPAKEVPIISDRSLSKDAGVSPDGPATEADHPVESSLSEASVGMEPVHKVAVQHRAENQEGKTAGTKGFTLEHETEAKTRHPNLKKNIVPSTPPAVEPVEQNVLEPSQAETQISQPPQPLPLEDVWPVQRQTAERNHAEAQIPVPDRAVQEVLEQEEHAQVREALREVSPGQPSDSTVEVITPRRRRPPSPPVLQEKEMPLPPSQPPAGVPEMIESAIGPLPSDLWELIGESPKPEVSQAMLVETPAHSGEPVQPRGDESLEMGDGREKAPIQRQEATGATQAVSTPQTMSTLQAMSAMRAAGEAQEMRISEQPSDEAESSAGQAADTGAAKSSPEMDMDELAARVYGEVKRRLAVEWERLRRRF